jgi:hypothetical protein
MARNSLPGDDASPAGKLYPQDRHAAGYGHPHHDKGRAVRNDGDIKPLRTEQGMRIERLRPGDDPTAAINKLYSEGRTTYGQPHPDTPRESAPKYKVPTRSPNDEPASYRQAIRSEAMTPVLSEQAPQFPGDKHGVRYDNDASGWVRGQGGQSPHPKFDSGPSGHRYERK